MQLYFRHAAFTAEIALSISKANAQDVLRKAKEQKQRGKYFATSICVLKTNNWSHALTA